MRLLKRPRGAGVMNYLLQFDPIEEGTDVVRYSAGACGGLIPGCVGPGMLVILRKQQGGVIGDSWYAYIFLG